jgi:hypothetical protein
MCRNSYSYYLFIYFGSMICLTTLSVAQTVQRRMMGWLVNNEWERMWQEAVVGFTRGTEENHEKPQSGQPVPGARCEPDMKQECQPFDRKVR